MWQFLFHEIRTQSLVRVSVTVRFVAHLREMAGSNLL